MPEPEWLARWRETRVVVDPDTIPMALDSFGVQRISPEAFCKLEFPETIFVIPTGPAFLRRMLTRRMEREMRTVTVSYAAALSEATKRHTEAKGSRHASAHVLGGAAWSLIRVEVSDSIRAGRSVVIDTLFPDDDTLRKFISFGFSTGARAVIALDLESIYEESWEDEFTGIYWLQE